MSLDVIMNNIAQRTDMGRLERYRERDNNSDYWDSGAGQKNVVTIFHHRPAIYDPPVIERKTRVCLSATTPYMGSSEWIVLDIPHDALIKLHIASKKVHGLLDLSREGQARIKETFNGTNFSEPIDTYFEKDDAGFENQPANRSWWQYLHLSR